ncbi:hypothetical protein TVAG_350070 [Trichomonas vaginalis G3]|uniref:Uncharacterized protein n=1 Tax=Trichomonas vaginalis (strain ATCC PRA-98 / G3) TaxID=412133 RepID=A2F3I8_TRIV3|nr:hypothetical protein TVAGG3_0194320 [Trichomonas vaginalis G3]EAY00511.1 hypothetical protein TVAG_350070 [Trichomonas vaginalis G3]KAI5550198.1 hypothetical protein TVAGG3_0194320 [Trichomonas vaginalis G3]|eukprot:XP_001313440.1 hypothetical protein [Trichomonas vaginalis G3]
MGCCCSSDPPVVQADQKAEAEYPDPVIPVAAAHNKSIFDSPFQKKTESEQSLLDQPQKPKYPINDDDDDSSSSVDQEMIKQLLNEVEVSDDDK